MVIYFNLQSLVGHYTSTIQNYARTLNFLLGTIPNYYTLTIKNTTQNGCSSFAQEKFSQNLAAEKSPVPEKHAI